ncbi:protein-L-isoaspartate O-methyltransferase [Pelomyxa schiedti]|nr:protein-L-isoaspartate O-methyltransferase [Pelomyxa schiedti]
MAWRANGRTNAELISTLRLLGVLQSERVANALSAVDRRKYCTASTPDPYADHPVPIGYGQTISAPHMHVMCLELLENYLHEGSRVLDVGSGSGYLSAALSLMVGPTGKVTGIDVVEQLVAWSISNVNKDHPELLESGVLTLKVGDGWKGEPSLGPFDAIHVGAAAATVPQALLDQLKPGGRMVIPVGNYNQELLQIDKDHNGRITQKHITDVMYVPLVKKLGGQS